MKVTDVKIRKTNGGSKVKGYARITFDKCFVVDNLCIIDGEKGLFVSMPNKKGSDGKYYDLAFPITKEFRQEIQDAVIKAFNE